MSRSVVKGFSNPEHTIQASPYSSEPAHASQHEKALAGSILPTESSMESQSKARQLFQVRAFWTKAGPYEKMTPKAARPEEMEPRSSRA